ncbi:Histone-lysine N-methyltransferase ehmt2, partial [Neofusicoccum ribis]
NGHEEVANLIRQDSMRRGYKNGVPMRDKTRLNQLRLEMACRTENEQALISLIQEGMDPNTRVENGHKNLLHVAYSKGWAKAARVLVDQGANIEALDVEEITPLIRAAWNGQFKCARMLCEVGANINALDYHGRNLLYGYQVDNHPEDLEALINAGADPNIKDTFGDTPLMGRRNPASIDIMLKHGSDPFIEAYSGSPLWNWTAITDKKMIVSVRKVLTEYPRERILKVIDTRASWCGATALANAAFNGSSEIVELLIEHGADINLIGSRYGTPIQAARKQGHHSLVSTLLKLGAKPQTMVLPNGQERAAWYWEHGLVHSMPSAEANGAWLLAPLLDGGEQGVDQKNKTRDDEGRISGSANYGWCVSMQTMDGAWIPV